MARIIDRCAPRSGLREGEGCGQNQRQREQRDRNADHPVAAPFQHEQLAQHSLDPFNTVPGERAMQEARQLRQHRRPARGLVANGAQQPLQSKLLPHPFLQKRFRGRPQVEVRIELAPEPFDVQKRLLQHDELRLDLDVEAARGLEQLQQYAPEGDFLQRPVEDRLAHRADRALELVDARVGGHPAGFKVRLRHAPVVALEKSEEILREVLLVDLGERAHDAEVERDVAAFGRDQDVSRVHVGVEEAVAEHLGEENLDSGASELRDVHTLPASSSARSSTITGNIPGRRILTAASVPPWSTARCTCATEALATGWGSNRSNSSPTGLPKARSTSAAASSAGNGGTRSWSFASSSARSAGTRSRRVESTWPNLMKMGPSASSARRSRAPRGSRSGPKKSSAFSARGSPLREARGNWSRPKSEAMQRIFAR